MTISATQSKQDLERMKTRIQKVSADGLTLLQYRVCLWQNDVLS